MQSAHIIGVGSYVPEKILTNRELETLVDTSDEWIVSRTGIRERRIAAPNETTAEMGARAGRAALQSAQVKASQIDLIILATMTADLLCPAAAGAIQANLQCLNACSFDLGAACSGFVYGLACASAFIQAGIYQNVLLIGSEKMSAVIDYSDRNTCVLFGDGAGACVISSQKLGWRVRCSKLGADGANVSSLSIPAGGTKEPATMQTVKERRHYLNMDGKEVFKRAVRQMGMACDDCLAKAHLTRADIDWLICHQANGRILDAVAARLQISQSRVVRNVERMGNTSAASIPLAISELIESGKSRDGDIALVSTFGAGFNWATAVLEQVSALR